MSESNAITVPATATSSPLKYLDRAIGLLRNLGLSPMVESNAPAVALLGQLSNLDEGRVVAIARVLQHSSHFNEIMRDEVASAKVSDRYGIIIKSFDSIRDDAKRMVDQMSDGKIDLRERSQNLWMKATRGDIPSRFKKIQKTFLDVSRDTSEQLEREANILAMYGDFRFAIKEGEIQAHELLQMQTARLSEAKGALEEAQAAVAAAGEGVEAAALARLTMARDEALRQVQDEDARYQVAKDMAENLQVAYATSEAIMARVSQAHAVKKRVNERAVVFFSTNETVFTALNTAFTTQQGLHETTQTLNAMVDGISKGIESVADVGDSLLHEGLKAGYGSTIGVQSVAKLVDAVVRFQETSMTEIADLRVQATRSADEIGDYVEKGKQRFARLVMADAVSPVGGGSKAYAEELVPVKVIGHD